MMRALLGLCLIWSVAFSAWGSEVHRQVERDSDLERELAFKLTIQDKHEDWRAQGLDKVFKIKGPSPEYVVRFAAKTSGKLKEFFGLALTLSDGKGMLVSVPLETQNRFTEKSAQLKAKALGLQGEEAAVRELSVQFMIKKELIEQAVLTIRCGAGNAEESYGIRLAEYVTKTKSP
jgi:hypothetical protein